MSSQSTSHDTGEAVADLTTLDNVKLILQEEREEVDEVLEYLIPAASGMIRHYTGRRFTTPVDTQTRTFIVFKDRTVYLDEVATVTSVKDVDNLTIEYQLLPETQPPYMGQYLILAQPVNPASLPEQHVDLFTINLRGPYPPTTFRPFPLQVKVAGTWGYTEVPDEIDYLCARTVEQWYKGGIAEFTQSYAGGVETVVIPDRLPTAVLKALSAWRMPSSR